MYSESGWDSGSEEAASNSDENNIKHDLTKDLVSQQQQSCSPQTAHNRETTSTRPETACKACWIAAALVVGVLSVLVTAGMIHLSGKMAATLASRESFVSGKEELLRQKLARAEDKEALASKLLQDAQHKTSTLTAREDALKKQQANVEAMEVFRTPTILRHASYKHPKAIILGRNDAFHLDTAGSHETQLFFPIPNSAASKVILKIDKVTVTGGVLTVGIGYPHNVKKPRVDWIQDA